MDHDIEACEHVHCHHCDKVLAHVLIAMTHYSPMSFTVNNSNEFQVEEPLGRGDLGFDGGEQVIVCPHCFKPLNR